MDESSFILQNQLHGLCVRLERASLLACDESWKGERTFPPFSSIGLILEGGGTIIVNGQELHPTRGQLYLLPAHTTQTFFTDARHPYRKYYCHFNITCHGTELFDLIRTPLCVDAQDTGAAPSLFQQMIAALLGQGLTAAVKAQQHMLDLLVYYLESCPPGQLSLVKTNFGPPLAKAISYVDANLHRMLTVQEMAKIAGYHPKPLYQTVPEKLRCHPRPVPCAQKNRIRHQGTHRHRPPHMGYCRRFRLFQPVLFYQFFQKAHWHDALGVPEGLFLFPIIAHPLLVQNANLMFEYMNLKGICSAHLPPLPPKEGPKGLKTQKIPVVPPHFTELQGPSHI